MSETQNEMEQNAHQAVCIPVTSKVAEALRYLCKLYPDEELNFSDPAFKSLENTCDSIFKQLHSKLALEQKLKLR